MAFTCKHCGSQFDTLPQLGGHAKTHKQKSSRTPASRNVQAEVQAPSSTLVQAERSRMEVPASTPAASITVQAPAIAPASSPASSPPSAPAPAPPPGPVGDIAWIEQQMTVPLKPEERARLHGGTQQAITPQQAAAMQQQIQYRTPPPPPDGADSYRQPNYTQQVVQSIDWNGLAQSGMNLLSEIIKERRMAKQGPSIEAQIGALALSSFAGNLGKQSGTTMGKGILSGDADQYVTIPVMQTMLGELTKQISTGNKQREEITANYTGLEQQLKDAQTRLAAQAQPQAPVYNMPPEAVSPSPAPAPQNDVVLEVHEQPQMPQGE